MGQIFLIDGHAKLVAEIIASLLRTPSKISVDPSNIKDLFHRSGAVALSIGSGSGQLRIVEASLDALITIRKETEINSTTRTLAIITGPADLSLQEVNEGLDFIKESFPPNTEIVFGVTLDLALANQARVTLMTTTG